MGERIQDAQFEEMPAPGTIIYWFAKHGHKSMWRLAWSIWWRILLMATAVAMATRILMKAQ